MPIANRLEKSNLDIKYFTLPIKKLVLLYIATLGLYSFYWFYKNWEAVKNSEDAGFLPTFRALFSVIFCYSLFKRVSKKSSQQGYTIGIFPSVLALVYIVFSFGSNMIVNVLPASLDINFVWLFITILGFVPLIPMQFAINYLGNQKNIALHKNFSFGEKITLIIGSILSALILFAVFSGIKPS